MPIILGSQSPRRKEILSFFDLPFKQASPDFDEDSIAFQDPPQDFVLFLSRGKADSLISFFPHDIILTADTIVYRQGKIFGKPGNHQEAAEFLKELSGQWHSVYTGLTIFSQGQYYQSYEETRVLFNSLTENQINTYLRSLPFADKAGGYMIQGAGSLIIKRIEGCYYNVVGLPLNALWTVLNQVGIDLWKYLKK